MPGPTPTPSRSRRSGKVQWTAAAASLLVLGAIALGVLWLGPGRGPEPATDGGSLAARLEEETAPGPLVPVAETAAPAAAPARDAPETRRIRGRVTAEGGEPLAEALVAWLPLSREDLRPVQHHDGLLVESSGDAESVPEPVRSAVAERVLTRVDEAGAYALELPLEPPGTLLAWRDGFETAIRDAGASNESDAAGTAPGTTQPAELRIDFALAAGGFIEGTVLVEATREPAAGMLVTAARVDPEDGRPVSFGDPGAGAPVAADGSFRLTGVPYGSYRVIPRSGESDLVAGPAASARHVSLDAGQPSATVSFQVERGASILGIVTGVDGHPFAGAECAALPAELAQASSSAAADRVASPVQRVVRSATDGTFELRALPPGADYIVAARAEGHPITASRVEIAPGAQQARVEIQLERGWRILGRAVRPDGAPAVGAPVRILPRGEDLPGGAIDSFLTATDTATADENGAFVLEGLRAGAHELIAGSVSPAAMLERRGAREVVLDGLADATGVVIILEEDAGPSFLSGLVVDSRGKPIGGAAVSVIEGGEDEDASTLPPRGRVAQTVTGPDGAFYVRDIQEGLHTVAADMQGYQGATLRNARSGSVRLVLRLAQNARIRGVVRSRDGAPPGPGGTVTVELAAGGPGHGELRPDGSFDVEAAPRTCRVKAHAPGFAPAWSREIHLAPGEIREGVEVLLSTGAVITGRVVSPGGASVAGATVTATPGRGGVIAATTDEDGRFELPHLAADSYSLRAMHEAHAPSAAISVAAAGDAAVEAQPLVLRAGGGLAGVVKDGEKPYAGILAQLVGEGEMQQAVADAEGRFSFARLAPGDYAVTMTDASSLQAGKLRTKTRGVTIAAGETAQLEARFGAGRRVHGRVSGLEPAPFRVIQLRRPGGPAPETIDPLDVQASLEAERSRMAVALIAPDGTYVLEDVEAGTYVLEIPRLPADPTDPEAYRKLDRTPWPRRELEVGGGDVELDIAVR